MSHKFHFTFNSLRDQLHYALLQGYSFVTCEQYYVKKLNHELKDKTIVLRVDIDLSCKKARQLAVIFNELGIKASFFVRLHAKEYNPFDFENYLCLRYIKDSSHEIGYHSEIIDQAVIWNEDAEACLIRDVSILNKMLNISIKGVASHGGLTGLNNLDFWKNKKASDFNLLYEAYEESQQFNLFKESFYISDSEWVRWKCYDKGVLSSGDNRSLREHLENHHSLVYLLIHPDTYFDFHIYE